MVPMARKLLMLRDCCAALDHLHSCGFLHCDVKSLNFLVAEVRVWACACGVRNSRSGMIVRGVELMNCD